MTSTKLSTFLLALLLAGALVAVATPAAGDEATADQGEGEIDIVLEPQDGEATQGDVQTYNVSIVAPDAGIGGYIFNVSVQDPSVGEIVAFRPTKSPDFGNNKITADGSTLVLDSAMGDAAYGNSTGSVTLTEVDIEATGSAGQSTDITLDNAQDDAVIDATKAGDQYTVLQTQNASFTVAQPDPANFTVSNLTPADATVSQAGTLDISTDIENVGQVQGTQTVTLTVGSLTQTKSVTLNASENTTVTFQDVDTGALAPGAYTQTVTTANDSVSGNLTVEPATVAVRPTESRVPNRRETTVELVARNVGNGVGSYDTEIALNNSVGQLVDSEVVAGSGDVATESASFGSNNETLSLNVTFNAGVGPSEAVVLASLTLAITDVGPVELAVANATATDTDGASYDPVETSSVVTGFGPPPVIGNTPPTDQTGDGLYEDVRGDGTVDIFDVQALFANLDTTAVTDYAVFYNFKQNNPNDVTIFDVQQLFIRASNFGSG